MGTLSAVDDVRALIEPRLAELNLELFDCELSAGTLRVSVDRPGGVDLDGVSAASTLVSDLLDRAAAEGRDPVPGSRYTLEVSSPGLERPLRTPEHFRRFVGSTITVKTNPSVPGERRLKGVLRDADDDGVTVDVEPEGGSGAGGPRRLSYADIERARTVFEWGPAPKPGRGPQAPRKKAAS